MRIAFIGLGKLGMPCAEALAKKGYDDVTGYDIEKKFDSISLNELDETSKEIAKLIDEQIKPAVAQDGGNIVFQSFDKKSGEVKVLLQGACSGCPSSTVTLKNGIETMLKNHLPEKINSVTAING